MPFPVTSEAAATWMRSSLWIAPLTKIAPVISFGAAAPESEISPRPMTFWGWPRGAAYTGSAKTVTETIVPDGLGTVHHQSSTSWPETVPVKGPCQYSVNGLPTKSSLAIPVVVCVTGVRPVGGVWLKVAPEIAVSLVNAACLSTWSVDLPWNQYVPVAAVAEWDGGEARTKERTRADTAKHVTARRIRPSRLFEVCRASRRTLRARYVNIWERKRAGESAGALS